MNALVDQSSTVTPSVIPNAPQPILGANGSDIFHHEQLLSVTVTDPVTRPNSTPPLAPPIRSSSPLASSIHRSNSMTHSPRPVTYDTSEIKVPPAHSIRDGMVPIVAGAVLGTPEPQDIDSGYITPVSNNKGSNLALEAPTEHPVTQTGKDSKVENDVRGSDLSGELRPVQEGKLLVIENTRFHQVPPPVPGPSGVELLMTEGATEVPGPTSAPITPSVADEPPRQGVSIVREVRQEFEPPNEPPPSVLLSVPAGEPRTPKKSTKNTSSPSPQKSGFLDSLKKVFHGGSGHRESSPTPQEKTREKEREKKREKAREREVRREERLREQEERREEHEREKQEKAKEKKNQKLAREHDREMRLLAPSSSSEDDEPIVDDDRYRKKKKEGEGEARTSKFVVGKKKQKKTEKEGMSLSASESRKDRDSDEPSWTADGFLMRKNTELEKNLKGGILEAKRGEQRAHEPGSRRSSSVVGMAMEDRRVGGDVSVQRSAFIVERGAKCTQSLRVSPFLQSSSVGIPSSSVPQAPPPPPRLHDTRFREELNSQNGTTSPKRRVLVDSGQRNASDTPLDAASAVVFPAIGVTAAVARRSSKKQSVMPSTVGGEGGKPISALNKATAPAGMSTGLGDKRGSVGTSVLTPHARMVGGTHRRAVSVDYGPPGRVSAPAVSRGSERGSLMSIVDDVTRSNRRAWDIGLVERGRVDDDDDVQRRRLLPEPGSSGVGGRDARMGLGGVWAPAKIVSSPGKAESRPLKSALRMNESPLPRAGKMSGLAPPVGRVRRDEDEDRDCDSASTSSSYETGHEDFDDEPRPEYGSPPVGEQVSPLLKRKSVRVSLKKSVAWDDDSSDDAYEQAKLSLLKATRKEKRAYE